MSSLVGTLGYIFSMSNEASLVPCMYGMSCKSSMRCVELLTLNAFGSGICSWISLLRCLASLYASAPFQFTMGWIGQSILCTFGNPRIFGAVGFMFVSFLLLFLGKIDWQDFIVVVTLL